MRLTQQIGDVHIILGGPRTGKSSVLRAMEWRLLDTEHRPSVSFFPVFVDIEYSRPRSLENFLFILVEKLQDAIARWKYGPGSIGFRGKVTDIYSAFIRAVPETTLSLHFFKVKLKLPEVADVTG
jgi:hypothetical protein